MIKKTALIVFCTILCSLNGSQASKPVSRQQKQIDPQLNQRVWQAIYNYEHAYEIGGVQTHYAAHNKLLEALWELFSGNTIPDPDGKNAQGETLLMWIVDHQSYDVETVKLLLKNGANPNIQDNNGWTALMHDMRRGGSHGIPQLLIEKGARLEIQDNDGMTALMYAAKGTGSKYEVEMLVAAGADPNKRNEKDGKTAIDYTADTHKKWTKQAIDAGLRERAHRERLRHAKEITREQTGVPRDVSNIITEYAYAPSSHLEWLATPQGGGWTSSKHDLPEIITTPQGIKKIVDRSLNDELSRAIYRKDFEAVKKLFAGERIPDIHGRGSHESWVIQVIDDYNDPAMVQFLVSLGADPDFQDSKYKTALDYACGDERKKAMMQAIEEGKKEYALTTSAHSQRKKKRSR